MKMESVCGYLSSHRYVWSLSVITEPVTICLLEVQCRDTQMLSWHALQIQWGPSVHRP